MTNFYTNVKNGNCNCNDDTSVSPQLKAVLDMAYGLNYSSPEEIRQQILNAFEITAGSIGKLNDPFKYILELHAAEKDYPMEVALQEPFSCLYFFLLNDPFVKDGYKNRSTEDWKILRCQFTGSLLHQAMSNSSEMRMYVNTPYLQYMKALRLEQSPSYEKHITGMNKAIKNIMLSDYNYKVNEQTTLFDIMKLTQNSLFNCAFRAKSLRACDVIEFLFIDSLSEMFDLVAGIEKGMFEYTFCDAN